MALRVTEDIATGSAILDVSQSSNRYLIAVWSGANTSGSAAGTVVDIYLRAAGEDLNQLVYTYKGGSIQSATLGPDERFALVTAYKEVDEAEARHSTSEPPR